MLCPAALALALVAPLSTAPAMAQMIVEPFSSTNDSTGVSGPYARYQRHILRLAKNRYAVLFEPGFSDNETALRAVQPLCAETGRRAELRGVNPPVDVVFANGDVDTLLGVRIDCR